MFQETSLSKLVAAAVIGWQRHFSYDAVGFCLLLLSLFQYFEFGHLVAVVGPPGAADMKLLPLFAPLHC